MDCSIHPMFRTCFAVVIGGTLGLSALLQSHVRGQGVLVGCRLGATLQCVPGLTMKPEQQIKVLEQQIVSDQQMEGAIRQTIQGLRKFELSGRTSVGNSLKVKLDFNPDEFEKVQIHWYRRQKNASNWQLVGTVDEVSYKLTSADLGSTVMAVIAMQPDGKGVIRQESNVMGPIKE